MTFRDFTKISKQDTENFSEHNYSVISNRDIDAINDITILFSEEKKSEIYRDTLMTQNNNSNRKNQEIEVINPDDVNLEKSFNLKRPNKTFMSEMDDFLASNEINRFKI